MSDTKDIPVLTDLIESGPDITLSDLGLDDDPAFGMNAKTRTGDIAIDFDNAAPIAGTTFDTPHIDLDTVGRVPADISPALEQAVRRIFDEHIELAWQEIRIAIQQHLDRS
jgi:hypothetical protein